VALQLHMEVTRVEQVAHACERLDMVEWLGDEVGGAALQRCAPALERGVGGQHDDRQVILLVDELRQPA